MPYELHECLPISVCFQALAWCPFQRHCLASGGGTADGYIRIWNAANGQQVSSVNAKSQVSKLCEA